MATFERGRLGLLPAAALALGLVSANLVRTPTAVDASSRPSRAASTMPKAAPPQAPAAPSLEDMRPVMELMADVLGVNASEDAAVRAARALVQDPQTDKTTRPAVGKLLTELERRRAVAHPGSGSAPKPGELLKSAQVVDGYLRSDADPSSRIHKLRDKVADTFLLEEHDNELLQELQRTATENKTHLQFLIVTIPDYVDSNSGWMSDQIIGSIQAAMGRADFVLDRFRLIDWTRAEPHAESTVTTESRLHERQPGALIFRKLDAQTHQFTYAVVLLVLETPTSGMHTIALRNAASFVGRWQPALKIVGPTFSGSIPSLAITLKRVLDDKQHAPGLSISVISGAANAAGNLDAMKTLAEGVNYQSTLWTTREIGSALFEAVASMSAEWTNGRRMALLVESNTAYGADAQPSNPEDTPFGEALVFRFPLHVAQLRSDAPESAPAALSLLPQSTIPLNLRETTPPSDQIPPLRPQLTSALVEAHVNSILDNLRHERISAVGIIATDDRDVLFLAREVRRAMPGVQLFFLGNDLLYLHPEYAPYMRGALVASTYPLTLNDQRDIGKHNVLTQRATFSSMFAQGIYNAMLKQLFTSPPPAPLLDYCVPAAPLDPSPAGCRPPVWISVIGDDTFWPLSYTMPVPPGVEAVVHEERTSGPSRRALASIPTTGRFIAVLMLIACLVHFGSLVYIHGAIADAGINFRRLMRWPVVRVMTPLRADTCTARLHVLSLTICLILVVLCGGWAGSVLLLHALLQAGVPIPTTLRALLSLVVLGLLIATIAICIAHQQQIGTTKPVAPSVTPMGRRIPTLVTLLMMVATLLAFGWFLGDLLWSADAKLPLDVERTLGAGVVSPAPATLCLFAALYVVVFSGLRRLSYLGIGYRALGHRSAAFRLFAGPPPERPGESMRLMAMREKGGKGCRQRAKRINDRTQDLRDFAGLLDTPMQQLPWVWTAGVLVTLLAAAWSVGWIATVDGRPFTWFMTLASYGALAFGLLLLAQAVKTWMELKPKLIRLAQTPLRQALKTAGSHVTWNLSFVPPRSCELRPLVELTNTLRRQLVALACATRELEPRDRVGQLTSGWHTLPTVRSGDLVPLDRVLDDVATLDRRLAEEINTEKFVPLLRSRVWQRIWKLSDRLVGVLERTRWHRLDTGDHDDSDDDNWFDTAEQLIALQFAFLIRDILSRLIWSLFTAMLCLTLVAAAHLFYIFQGRSSLLTLDIVAIGIAALGSIRVLVEIERDTIISELRDTRPGEIDFSWEFARRIAVYGVLPLLAVVASLFPEVGDSVFRWLEPLRKLTTF